LACGRHHQADEEAQYGGENGATRHDYCSNPFKLDKAISVEATQPS
jgi:hypothetical protein